MLKQIKNPRRERKQDRITKKIIVINLFVALILGIVVFLATKKIAVTIIAFFSLFGLLGLYSYARIKYNESLRIKTMENVFPDFLQLMASNLRAGITTDNALLLSSRKEFAPLDKEIIRLGKDIITGKHIEQALMDMSERIGSEKIEKTINLLVSGIRSGGNIAILLEETATNMKERGFVEKRSASSVLMYVIFIFFASAVGAPALFGLSSVLVQILSNILATIPAIEASAASRLPFTLTKLNISPAFVSYFAVVFLIITNIIGAFVIGIVGKGEEKAGVRYLLPLIILSLVIFFTARIVLLNFFSGFF